MTQKHTAENEAPEEVIKDDGIGENEATEAEAADTETPSEEPAGEDWQAKAEEYLGDWKRTQAEFENYKKRQAASQKELGGYLIEKLILDIIPVLDNFRAATQHVPAEQKESPWVVGIQYIEKQLEAVIIDNGIQAIEVKEGDVFDPSIHEAVGQTAHTEHHGTKEQSRETAVEKEEQLNIVSKVIHKGYKFGDRVIRPARVIVN